MRGEGGEVRERRSERGEVKEESLMMIMREDEKKGNMQVEMERSY